LKPRLSRRIIVVILVGLIGCGLWVTLTPCPGYSDTFGTPDFIESVWPPPQTETLLSCYIKRYLLVFPAGTGIGVTIDTQSIRDLEITQLASTDVPPFPERVFLYVDGDQVQINRKSEGGGALFTTVDDKYVDLGLAGWYFFGSGKFLSFGDHEAKVVIATKSGQTLEYEWTFTIK